MDLDARLDKSRTEVRGQRQRLADCLRRSVAVRADAAERRRAAMERLAVALERRRPTH